MPSPILIATVFIANLALCFSMKRHVRLVSSNPLPPSWERGIRIAAFVVLFVAARGFIAREGAVIGSAIFVGWFTVFQIGMAATVTLLSQKP